MLKNILKNLRYMDSRNSNSDMSNPIELSHQKQRQLFLRGMSKNVLELHVRKNDIKNFTKLALSDPDDTSHNNIVNNLIKDRKIVDVLSQEEIINLSSNEKLMNDLNI